MTAQLTPEDFRADLTDQDVIEINLEQRMRLIDEEIWRTYEWDMRGPIGLRSRLPISENIIMAAIWWSKKV